MSISRAIQGCVNERLNDYYVEAYSSHYVLHHKSGKYWYQNNYRARKDVVEEIAHNVSHYVMYGDYFWKALRGMMHKATRDRFRKKTGLIRKEVEKDLINTLEW